MQNMVEGGDEDWRLVHRDVVKGLVFNIGTFGCSVYFGNSWKDYNVDYGCLWLVKILHNLHPKLNHSSK